jgi:hypothetical protein
MRAHFFGGLPGPGLSWFLNRSMSSSNQIKILRLLYPTELILFSGFWAYFCAVSTPHPHILATSLLIYIFISAIALILQNSLPENPAGNGGYFTNRKVRRMISRAEAPAASMIKPTVPKSIAFSPVYEYGLRAGPYGPAPLTNLSGQSGRGLNLLWLLCPPRLQAPVAGSSNAPSFISPPSGFSNRYDTINILHTVYYVKSFLEKSSKKTLFSGVKNIFGKTRPVTEAVWHG